MTKIFKIFNDYSHILSWTVWYMFFISTTLYLLFKFNIFSAYHWHILAHARLTGFAGFVFSMFILAIIPVYIATIKLTISKKEMPIKLPKLKIPNCIIELWQDAPTPEPVTPAPETTKKDPEPTDTTEQDILNNTNIPTEIRNNFLQATKKAKLINITAPKNLQTTPDTLAIPATPNDLNEDIPLPTDFDFQFNPEETNTERNVIPTFSAINFDKPTTPTPIKNKMTTHLDNKGQKYTTEQDIIITDQFAIATHDDSDLWVTDNENWFASGQSRPSPIIAVKKAATTHNVTPVMYLETQNILDLDDLKKQWESDGIRIITTPEEL